MSFLLKLLTAISLIFLTHAIYSAYEHTTILAAYPHLNPASDSSRKLNKLHLPADIILETLISTLLLTACIVYSAPALRPIRWNEWAGLIERSGWIPGLEDDAAAVGKSTVTQDGVKKGVGSASGAGNPYRGLEERRGFWDVRAARQAFADFIRDGNMG